MSAHPALAARPRRTAIVLGILALLALAAAGILWPRPGPAAANPLSGMAAVAAGYSHTCAVTTADGAKCWGMNYEGQLGDGTTTDRSTPVDVSGLTSGVAAVAAGGGFVTAGHTCALTTAGGVQCWGNNYDGQLGDGTTTDRSTPVDVSGLTSGVAAVAAGNYHTCVLTTGGGLECWGNNYGGQLGDGTTTSSTTPMDVTGLTSGVAAVAAGNYHTCALTTGGGLKCWGRNDFGQVGDGTTTRRTTPVDVSGLTSGVAAVAAGGSHTCALTTAGGLKCWGDNYDGQLGDETTAERTTAVDVSGLTSGVAAVAAGADHTCALTTAGGLKCWGRNSTAQLGDGTRTRRTTPVDVSGLTGGIEAVGAGGIHTCALTTGGGVKCWGSNEYGQVGDGTSTERTTPVDVVELAAKPTPTSTPCPPEGCPTPTITPTPAPQTGLDFSMGIDVDGDTTDDCDSSAGPSKCTLDGGAPFTLNFYLKSFPEGVSDYQGYDGFITYAGVTSKENVLDVWPDCVFSMSGELPEEDPAQIFPNCAIGLPPAPPSTYTGLMATAELNCSEDGDITMHHGPADTNLVERAVFPVVVRHVEGEGTTETLTINCVPATATNTPTPTATPPPKPRIQKLEDGESLVNNWLERQGDKIPPGPRCADGDDVTTFEETMSMNLRNLDPKGTEGELQQIGAFSFEVRYDDEKVCVNLAPSAVWQALIDSGDAFCQVDDKDQGKDFEGIARIGCITVGKPESGQWIDTTTDEGKILAIIEVRPQPEVYSQLRPNQDNGVMVQIENVDCKISDIQGHNVSIYSCEDADITFRYLEGDVEPDCQVDVVDDQSVAFRWGFSKGSVLYNERYDLQPSGQVVGDGDIDILDLQFIFGRVGSTCDDPWPAQEPQNPKL